MASSSDPIPVNSQKHDPAWRHCQMFKNGDRVKLKCIYCGKVFSGGGIHRIKEHLAGQKGNAASCLRVLPDVQHLMQQSLDGVVVKKKKKQKIVEEITNLSPVPGEIDSFAAQSEMNTGFQLVAVPSTLEPNSSLLAKTDEGITNQSLDRRKRGRVRNSSPTLVAPDAHPISNFSLGSTRVNNQVHMAIGRFLYDVGAPLDAVNSIYFQPMIDAIASEGPGLVAPSYHDLRGWILKNSVEEVKNISDQYKVTWGRTGCSVLVDEWTTETGRTLINFLVYCPEGTMFLKSVDASDIVRSTDVLYELLKEVVEEVGVNNVLQVITDSAEHSLVAGKKLAESLPTLYWTPCAAHCIDLMFRDFEQLEWIHTILEQAKSITRFIYNHNVVLNMMRRYTFGNDLVEPAITRFATNFTTLQRMVSLKHNLQAMVTSQEWMDCPYSKKPGGLAMIKFISSQSECSHSFWSSCSLIIRLMDPLLRVLRMVSSEKRPAMAYIYAGIYRAKEAIKKELVKKKDCVVYWNIIDHRWDRKLHCPLHAAGFYLNPKFFYSIEGDVHNEISSAMLDCIERLVPDIKVQDKIIKELNAYKNAVGDFGRKMAIRARDTLLPAEWWSTYGGGCPNLARLATRILSQTCSAIVCKHNHIPLKKIQDTRNCLEHQRLNDLVFVQYNLRLRQMLGKNKELDPISFDIIDTVEDWVTEKDVSMGEYGSSDWMALDQPVVNTMLLGSSNDEAEGLDTGFEDDEIYNGIKDDEEENVEVQ